MKICQTYRKHSYRSTELLGSSGSRQTSQRRIPIPSTHRKLIFTKARAPALNYTQCTFIAGVQAHFITNSNNQADLASQIVNALFFAGLFADIGAATLSAASGRWYEMLTPEEADHVYDWVYASENSTPPIPEEEGETKERTGVESGRQITNMIEKGITTLEGEGNDRPPSSAPPQCWYLKERWLYLSLKAGPYIAVLGLLFLTAGLMVWVWANQTIMVQVLCSVLCVLLVVLLPPFVLPHDRIRALTFVKMQRYSG